MNTYLLAAALLSILIGIIHSILGEMLIFKKLRNNALVPTLGASPLNKSNIRIIWATWHLASILGFAIGAILINLANEKVLDSFIINSVSWAMMASSILVCYATKGKHPGWFGLLLVSLLCFLA